MDDAISYPLDYLGLRESKKATAPVVSGGGRDLVPIQNTKQQLLETVIKFTCQFCAFQQRVFHYLAQLFTKLLAQDTSTFLFAFFLANGSSKHLPIR